MRQRVKNALQLFENNSINELINHFLVVNYQRPRFDALFVAMLNRAEQQLTCYHPIQHQRYRNGDVLPTSLGTDDFTHPLAHVLQRGSSVIWPTLNRGARIEHPTFHNFVRQLEHDCGLYAHPIVDHQNQICGIVALFAEDIDRFIRSEGMFLVYFQAFQLQMRHLSEIIFLRNQLQQVREVLNHLKSRQQQLDVLLENMHSNTAPQPVSVGLTPIDQVSELDNALNEYEAAILRQRMNLYGSDRKAVADSLNIAKRALDYKITKLKGLL